SILLCIALLSIHTSSIAFKPLSLHDALPIYQRYGSSHIGATAKDISNVVTDAASGVVNIFHGIDKAVADTWKISTTPEAASVTKIGRAVQQECRDRTRMPSAAFIKNRDQRGI